MKKSTCLIAGLLVATLVISGSLIAEGQASEGHGPLTVKPGAFSMSLSVKNLAASREFYEILGFMVFGGDTASHYLIMKNGNCLIGLFQGMFQGNILTFNPGWDENAKQTDPFTDVREIQKLLKDKGIPLVTEADEKTGGPASFMVKDPDGNLLLFDQFR